MFGGTRASETEEPTTHDNKKWTIYSLKLPTPMTLYKVTTNVTISLFSILNFDFLNLSRT